MSKNRQTWGPFPTAPNRRDEWIKYALMGMLMRNYPPAPEEAAKKAVDYANALEKALIEPENPADAPDDPTKEPS